MTSRRLRAAQRREALENPRYGWIWKPLLTLLILALLVMVGLGVWWTQTPKAFDVEGVTAQQRQSSTPAGRGAVSVATLKQLLDTLQDKPGGYLRDDVLPPGVVMDNMPAWEWGVLQQAQLMSQQLRHFDPHNAPTMEALDAAMRGDADNWILSSTGQQLAAASAELGEYLARFDQPQSSQSQAVAFAANGQGLAAWLGAVRAELAPLTEQLSASVGDTDALVESGIAVPESLEVAWYRVDNHLYQARGQSWALSRLMAAVLRDQRDIIESAGMLEQWQRAQAELQRTQRRLWSPIVLRGSGFGILANYPLTMAHHLTRLDASLAELEAGLAMASSESPQSDSSAAAEEPSAAVEQQSSAAVEQQSSSAAVEQQSSAVTEQQSSAAAEEPSAAAEQQPSAVTEQQSSAAVEQQSSAPAEEPSAAQQQESPGVEPAASQ